MKKPKRESVMELIHPMSAGIDVSSSEHVVAVSPRLTELAVRKFGSFTQDLQAISQWLQSLGIQTVAMESTGVYWLNLYLQLEADGIEVYLVNAKHVKNVRGKKTDESDAQWIQRLHSCGLLERSFQPDLNIRELRHFTRIRKDLIGMQQQHKAHMLKSFEQMNIKISQVLTDITGKSGMKIIAAILAGERNTAKLSQLAHSKVKASKEEICKALEGQWHEMYLFSLRQAYELYKVYDQQRQELDRQIHQWLKKQQQINSGLSEDIQSSKPSKSKNHFKFDAHGYLRQIIGIDLTKVWGISEINAMELISEIGLDMSKWKTAKHFTSWLGLAPNTKISGGKKLSSRVPKKRNHAGQTFRMIAYAVKRSAHPLGEFYRKIRSKLGPKGATVATARKIATYVYHMLKNKVEFNTDLLLKEQQQAQERQRKYLEKKAAKLGLSLQPI